MRGGSAAHARLCARPMAQSLMSLCALIVIVMTLKCGANDGAIDDGNLLHSPSPTGSAKSEICVLFMKTRKMVIFLAQFVDFFVFAAL